MCANILKHSGEEEVLIHGVRSRNFKMIPLAQVGAALEERAVLAGNDEAGSDHYGLEHRGEDPASCRGVQGVQDGPGGQGDPDGPAAQQASCPDGLGGPASVSASPSLVWASCRGGGWELRAPGCLAYLFSMLAGNL